MSSKTPAGQCTGRSKNKIRAWLDEHHPTWQTDTAPRTPERQALWDSAPYDDVRCGQKTMDGGAVCYVHGGKAPQVKVASLKREQTRQAAALVARFGLRRDIGPLEAVQEALERKAGSVSAAEAIVSALDTLGDGTPAVLALYEMLVNDLGKLGQASVSLGLEKRKVELEESRQQELADVLLGFATEMGQHFGFEPDPVVVYELASKAVRKVAGTEDTAA